ncbi:MAG: hypothetical protein H7249_01320 [Chitinophagaceae bacterium]|nr:hypothetical protein [Oligoflexus sp.]
MRTLRLATPMMLVFLTAASLLACVHGPGKNEDKTPELAAPNPDKSRMFDCMGENQTTHGTTRPDCLPNDADGASRDTESGSGAMNLFP